MKSIYATMIGLIELLAAASAAGSVIDVTTLGVIGDGVISNTANLQKAIDGLGVAGGTLRFPAGR